MTTKLTLSERLVLCLLLGTPGLTSSQLQAAPGSKAHKHFQRMLRTLALCGGITPAQYDTYVLGPNAEKLLDENER